MFLHHNILGKLIKCTEYLYMPFVEVFYHLLSTLWFLIYFFREIDSYNSICDFKNNFVLLYSVAQNSPTQQAVAYLNNSDIGLYIHV